MPDVICQHWGKIYCSFDLVTNTEMIGQCTQFHHSSQFSIFIFLQKYFPLQKTAWNLHFFFFCNCHTTFDLKYICIDKPTVYKQILFSNHSMSEEAVRVLSAGTTQTFSSSFLRNIFFLGRTQARKR